MGRFLEALRADAEAGKSANPAKPANLQPVEPTDSQIRRIRNGAGPEIAEPVPDRARLLALAADELLPADLVHLLADADVALCTGLGDLALRAYLRVLDREDAMARGIVPDGWDAVAHCEACGPVHWHVAERLKGCAWCKHRRALRAIPRPRVRCGECAYYQPDRHGPTVATGRCGVRDGAPRYWPKQEHRCRDMRPRGDEHGE